MRNSEAKRLLLNRDDAICSRMSQTEALSRKTMQCEAEESRRSHYASKRVSKMMQRLEQLLEARSRGASQGSSRRDASRDDKRGEALPETVGPDAAGFHCVLRPVTRR